MEVWKPIPKFSSYEVSSLGRLRRVRDYDSQGPRKPLPYVLTVKPLGRVRLRGDNYRVKSVSVARLVAAAFIPTTKTGLVVGYRDGNPANVHADNLGWLLRSSPRWYPRRPRFWVDSPTTKGEN